MDTDFEQFQQIVSVSKTDICTTRYRENPDLIRIRKEHVAVRIIDSTLRLANAKDFSPRAICATAPAGAWAGSTPTSVTRTT